MYFSSHVRFQIFEMLGTAFGFTKNSKGYKELPSYLRVIQGDGINYDTCREILQCMKEAGLDHSLYFSSSTNRLSCIYTIQLLAICCTWRCLIFDYILYIITFESFV